MRFTSLVIELIRARPRLIVWIVVAAAGRDVAVRGAGVLPQPARYPRDAAGFRHANTRWAPILAHPCRSGSPTSPIALPAAHMFGVYLLAELCEIATFITLYYLSRAWSAPRRRCSPCS